MDHIHLLSLIGFQFKNVELRIFHVTLKIISLIENFGLQNFNFQIKRFFFIWKNNFQITQKTLNQKILRVYLIYFKISDYCDTSVDTRYLDDPSQIAITLLRIQKFQIKIGWRKY